jgi:hypothetical protein
MPLLHGLPCSARYLIFLVLGALAPASSWLVVSNLPWMQQGWWNNPCCRRCRWRGTNESTPEGGTRGEEEDRGGRKRLLNLATRVNEDGEDPPLSIRDRDQACISAAAMRGPCIAAHGGEDDENKRRLPLLLELSPPHILSDPMNVPEWDEEEGEG